MNSDHNGGKYDADRTNERTGAGSSQAARAYYKYGSPDSLSDEEFMEAWEEIFGKSEPNVTPKISDSDFLAYRRKDSQSSAETETAAYEVSPLEKTVVRLDPIPDAGSKHTDHVHTDHHAAVELQGRANNQVNPASDTIQLFDFATETDGANALAPQSTGNSVFNPTAGTIPALDPESPALRLAKRREARAAAKAAKGHRFLHKLIISLVILASLYGVFVYSDIPFIAKWRTLYIETAMSTMSHQWLATAFLPDSVIDEVLADRDSQAGLQVGLESDWSIDPYSSRQLYRAWKKEKKQFAEVYSEIDQDSFNAYLDAHPDEFINDDGYLVIDKAGLDDGGTDIKTVYGDQVLAVDTYNAITIIKIKGDGYVARLAIIKDPSRVGIGLSPEFGKSGAVIADIAEANQAVLAINANGFYDPSGQGNGGNVFGLVVKDGKVLNQSLGGNNKAVGFNRGDRLDIGGADSARSFRDAAEFKPALIINGQVLVSGSAGWGIQPRSAIGQTKKGEVLMLIVDGRKPGYSIGCTVSEAARVLQQYGAWQAINLDGGSSAIMYYNGREITKPSAADKVNGRKLPDGFIVSSRD